MTQLPSLYSVLLALPPTCSLLLPLPLGSLFGSQPRWPSCTSLAADTSLPQREPPLLRLSPVSARPLASPYARTAPSRSSSQSENSSAACTTACTRGARSSRCAPRSPQTAFGPRARVSLRGEEKPLARPLASTVHITLFAPERWQRARDTGCRTQQLYRAASARGFSYNQNSLAATSPRCAVHLSWCINLRPRAVAAGGIHRIPARTDVHGAATARGFSQSENYSAASSPRCAAHLSWCIPREHLNLHLSFLWASKLLSVEDANLRSIARRRPSSNVQKYHRLVVKPQLAALCLGPALRGAREEDRDLIADVEVPQAAFSPNGRQLTYWPFASTRWKGRMSTPLRACASSPLSAAKPHTEHRKGAGLASLLRSVTHGPRCWCTEALASVAGAVAADRTCGEVHPVE